MRIKEKKSKSFSQITINGQNDGFSLLTTKEMTKYVDIFNHINIRYNQEILS